MKTLHRATIRYTAPRHARNTTRRPTSTFSRVSREAVLGSLIALVVLGSVAACTSGGRPIDTRVDDASITEKVEARLGREDALRGSRIDVVTYDGVVTLTGWAPTRSASSRAGLLAGDVEGVTTVRNLIRVGGRDADDGAAAR